MFSSAADNSTMLSSSSDHSGVGHRRRQPLHRMSTKELHEDNFQDNYSFAPVAVEDAALTNHSLHEPLLAAVKGNHHNIGRQPSPTSSLTSDSQDESHPSSLSLFRPLSPPSEDETTTTSQPLPSFRQLWIYKSIYFLNSFDISAFWRLFGTLYYHHIQNLTAHQIGRLHGVAPILSSVSQPLWGYLADVFQSRKWVFLLCKGVSIALFLALSLSSISTTSVAAIMMVAGMSFFHCGGVLDAHTVDFLGETSHRGLYGSIRLWTTVSWGLGAVGMGWITDHFGVAWNFGILGGMTFVMLFIVMVGLPTRSQSEQELYYKSSNTSNSDNNDNPNDYNNRHSDNRHPCEGDLSSSSGPQWKVLWNAIGRLPVFVWMLEVSIMGAGISVVDSFLVIFLQKEFNASTELCGCTVGVTVLLEVPLFYCAQQLLSGLGHDVLFLLSMLAYASRVILYTYLTTDTVYWVLLLELFSGMTFACLWISSIEYAAIVAPKGWSTAVQSILSSALYCVGGGLGPVVGGWVMDAYGPCLMFRGIGMVVATMFVLHLIVLVAFRQGHDNFLKQLQEERLQQTRQEPSMGDEDNQDPLTLPLLNDMDMEHA